MARITAFVNTQIVFNIKTVIKKVSIPYFCHGNILDKKVIYMQVHKEARRSQRIF
jgi:hypothetical protein